MNFKQYFLQESPTWDDQNKDMGFREPKDKTTNTAEYDNAEFKRFTKASKKFNEIKVGDFTVVGYKNEDNYYIWSISKDSHIVGQLIVDIWPDEKLTPKANNMVVYKNYQRNGLSEAMYRMVIEDAGLLVSSNSLTGEDEQGGSFDVWKKLSTIYPYSYIYQKYPKPAILKPVKTFERSNMGNSSQYFIVSKKPLESTKINESPYIQDSNKTIGDKSIFAGAGTLESDIQIYKDFKKDGKLINTRKFKNYIIETWKDKDISEFVFDDTGKMVGHLSMFDNENKKPTYPQVSYVWIDQNNQGEGLGTELYEWAIKKFGGIISDLTLTSGHKGSYSLWKRLGQKYQLWAIQKIAKQSVFTKLDNIDDAMNSNIRLIATDKSLEQIDEAPEFDDDMKTLSKKRNHHEESDIAILKNVKDKYDILARKEYPNFSLELYGDDVVHVYYMFAFDKKGVVIGRLTAQQELKVSSDIIYPQVKLSFVYEDWQGKGVGKAMYKEMINHTNGLTSDSILTGEDGFGSFQMWQSLGRQYYSYVITKDYTGGYLSGIIIREAAFTRNEMHDPDSRLMVSKTPILEKHIEL